MRNTTFHTKAIIATRTEEGATIELVRCTPRPEKPRAREFYEERSSGKRIAFDGGGVIFSEWQSKGWA